MSYFVNTMSIRRWAETTNSRAMLPHVIRQLVWATVDRYCISKVDFPAYESVQRPGFDGEVICDAGNAWVPTGRSVWELSVDGKNSSKADRDFDKRTSKTPKEERDQTTYVCLTARHWQKKAEWVREREKTKAWKAVKAYDADDLEQWLEAGVGVAVWFAGQIGNRPEGVDDPREKWLGIAGSTKPPFNPEVFLVSRDASLKRLRDWLCGSASELVITSRSPSEIIDFFCAVLTSMDENDRLAFGSRSVLVESLSAFRILRDNTFPAILVVDPSIEPSPEEIGRAVTKGHHVLVATEPQFSNANENSALERASEFNLAQSLEKCGIPPVAAEQHAKACGGSLAILKSRLARVHIGGKRQSVQGVSPQAAIVCLLIGGWDGRNSTDRQAIERLAGRTYDDLESEFQKLATCRDPLLFHASGNWRLLSKDDAWVLHGKLVTPSAFTLYESLAAEILADDDPRFELPDDERWLARIKGHAPRYSGTIKTHVAQTLAFLGAFGEKLEAASSISVVNVVDRTVRNVLSSSVTWHRWATLGQRLALLAEASPQVFLRAVQEDLGRETPELLKLLHEDEQPLFGSCNHAGLLWALETLAWPTDLLPTVCRILIRLAADDPGGRWGNRPHATLSEVLSYWMPYTTAGLQDRIKVLSLLVAERREAAWPILLKLLPGPAGGVSSPTHRPLWRDWANSWSHGVPRGESFKFITAVGELIIQQAGSDVRRWKDILDNLGSLPYTVHDQLLKDAERIAQSNLEDSERRLLADELSEQINRHRAYPDADWTLPVEILDRLESLLPILKPKSAVLRHAWLFSEYPDRFYERAAGSYQERELALDKAREDALREILSLEQFDGVRSLSANAKHPNVVGRILAMVTKDQFLAEIIPSHLIGDESQRVLAGGYIWNRFYTDGWDWADAAIARCNCEESKAWFLVVMRFGPDAWNRAHAAGGTVASQYWNRCRAFNPDLDDDALETAVLRLVEHDRPGDAIDLLAMAIHGKKTMSFETLIRPLEALLLLQGEIASQQMKRADHHDIGVVIEELQGRKDGDETRLSRIEWNYLRLLDEHSGHAPRTLICQLCLSPQFFIELLSLVFRSRNEPELENDPMTEAEAKSRSAQATQAYRLFHEWKQIPGSDDTTNVDESALRQWCDEARSLAIACGRIEVCDSQLGQLFAHAPADDDGKWPCRAVRRVIESVATESLGSGLHCGIFNSRGAGFRGTGGDQERELAAKYRSQAEAIRFDAPFTSDVLMGLARDYEHQAKDWDERDRWNE